jgi:hypothetical protein
LLCSNRTNNESLEEYGISGLEEGDLLSFYEDELESVNFCIDPNYTEPDTDEYTY